MTIAERVERDWEAFPFDREVVVDAIPAGTRTSGFHLSITPVPANGKCRVMGRMANGGIGSVTLCGSIYAAKLPFTDRTIRIQYLGETRAVAIHLESWMH